MCVVEETQFSYHSVLTFPCLFLLYVFPCLLQVLTMGMAKHEHSCPALTDLMGQQ